jgi:OmpR-family two-component system manganese-sensing sensor histidine kinase
MAADIGWQTSKRRSLQPFDLERRLLLSYLSVFVAVLALFAVATHVAFLAIFQREFNDRLQAMARTAVSVVDATRTGVAIDLSDETIRALNPRTEGLRWSDAAGRVVERYGVTPRDPPTRRPPSAPVTALSTQGQSIRTLAMTARVGDHGERQVFVEASLLEVPYARRLGVVDLSILGALFLAIVGSLIAGRWLTHQLVQGLESNMKSLQDFTADAAHELRGPLTAIAANTAGAVPLDAQRVSIERRAMDSIASATAQMIRVSEDLLTLARVNQPLERELFVVDLDSLVTKIAGLYGEEARRKEVQLKVEIVGRTRVYGNPDQIERIVANLVQNAIRYTPSGGTVSVVCAKDRRSSRVTVSDTGIGIAKQHLERTFDRFWRADPSRAGDGGSGLGLTIARELARRHGGDITVTSRVGVGSTFTVTFQSRAPRSLHWS